MLDQGMYVNLKVYCYISVSYLYTNCYTVVLGSDLIELQSQVQDEDIARVQVFQLQCHLLCNDIVLIGKQIYKTYHDNFQVVNKGLLVNFAVAKVAI